MEYQTKVRRYLALHNAETGESVIQEIGTSSFETVKTEDFLASHDLVHGESSPVKRRKRRTAAEIASESQTTESTNGAATKQRRKRALGVVPEPVLAQN